LPDDLLHRLVTGLGGCRCGTVISSGSSA